MATLPPHCCVGATSVAGRNYLSEIAYELFEKKSILSLEDLHTPSVGLRCERPVSTATESARQRHGKSHARVAIHRYAWRASRHRWSIASRKTSGWCWRIAWKLALVTTRNSHVWSAARLVALSFSSTSGTSPYASPGLSSRSVISPPAPGARMNSRAAPWFSANRPSQGVFCSPMAAVLGNVWSYASSTRALRHALTG